jgi:hypothetical protein
LRGPCRRRLGRREEHVDRELERVFNHSREQLFQKSRRKLEARVTVGL